MKTLNPIYILLAFGFGFLASWYFLPAKVVKVPVLPVYEVMPNYVIELVYNDTVKIQCVDTVYTVPFNRIEETIINDNL